MNICHVTVCIYNLYIYREYDYISIKCKQGYFIESEKNASKRNSSEYWVVIKWMYICHNYIFEPKLFLFVEILKKKHL